MQESYTTRPGASTHNGSAASTRPLTGCKTPCDTFIALRARGFWPVATHPKQKRPIGTKWGAERWTVDKAAQAFKDYTGAGVGVCLGPGRAPDGGWLADIEGDGPEAEASRVALFQGENVETIGWASARGYHRLFRGDGERLKAIATKLRPYQVADAAQPGVFHVPALPGLELRLGGHKAGGEVKQVQSIVPPTVGTDGKAREWNGVETVADLPEAFYTALEAIAEKANAKPEPEPTAEPQAEAKPAGDGLTMEATNSADTYLKKALANAVSRIESKGPGERRDRYRNEAYNLAGWLHYHERYRIGYSEAELTAALKAARAIGVGPDDPVVIRTVDEAVAAGKNAPRDIPKADVHQAAVGATRNGTANGKPTGASPGASVDHTLAKRPRTDLGNAERLVTRHGQDLRYCHPWKRFLVWDGRRWKLDDTGEARRRAKKTVRGILGEARTIEDDEKRKAHALWGLTSEKRDKIAAMLHLAEVEDGIPILPAAMDADPWSFNCRNGTVDLRTGELRPHRREDLITKVCDLDYDPEADCPLWLATLATFFHREDRAKQTALVGYWQKLCGYALTGVIRDHLMPVAYGTGSNGKSTLLGTLLEVFGTDYAMKCPPDMLMAKKTDSHPTDRADLFGKRLVVAIETEAGRRLNETMIKELTGGDSIRARRMREDFWEFKPTHTLIMATNHKPAVRGTDHGIWRRLKLVPFTVAMDDAQADKAMPEKLRDEYPGILAWCVRGCLAWQEDGLATPAEVTEATASYRREQDIIGAFLDECTTRSNALKVKASDLYKRYTEWAEAGREHVASMKMFSAAIEERGIEKKTSNGVWYMGLGLKTY